MFGKDIWFAGLPLKREKKTRFRARLTFVMASPPFFLLHLHHHPFRLSHPLLFFCRVMPDFGMDWNTAPRAAKRCCFSLILMLLVLSCCVHVASTARAHKLRKWRISKFGQVQNSWAWEEKRSSSSCDHRAGKGRRKLAALNVSTTPHCSGSSIRKRELWR